MAYSNCPVCGKRIHGYGWLKNRENLTCGDECRKKQRAVRQIERRMQARHLKANERGIKYGWPPQTLEQFKKSGIGCRFVLQIEKLTAEWASKKAHPILPDDN